MSPDTNPARKIIVLESDKLLGGFIRSLLSSVTDPANTEVVLTSSVEQTFLKLDQQPDADLVFPDRVLGKNGGRHFAGLLRSKYPSVNPIVTSMGGDPSLQAKYLKIGVKSFVELSADLEIVEGKFKQALKTVEKAIGP